MQPIRPKVFGVAEFLLQDQNWAIRLQFFLTSKTCFSAFIVYQARIILKNSEQNHRSVFLIFL